MAYTYTSRKRAENAAPQNEPLEASSLDALRSGAVKPTQEQMGHRVDLPDAMREKMENAFGADLSAVKLYESQAVDDAGANAVAQGSNIAFAPGMLDFTSYSGQALLGHEISHVVSQARGEVTGSGFLNDHALEARADREGAMAAAGQTVAVPDAAMSPVSAASASGPMQAGKKERREGNKKLDRLYRMRAYTTLGRDAPLGVMPTNEDEEQQLLHSLSDYELDMLQQRAINSDLKTYKYNEKLKSNRNMSQGERLYRTALNPSNIDASIYKSLLGSFRAGPDHMLPFDDDPTTHYAREQASNARVMGGLSARDQQKLTDLTNEYGDAGTQAIADFGETDAARAADDELLDFRKRYLRSEVFRLRHR